MKTIIQMMTVGNADVQRDLGILEQQSLKANIQKQQAIEKADGMLAFIARYSGYSINESYYICKAT